MLNTYIKNRGITQTLINNNNQKQFNQINWDADYAGLHFIEQLKPVKFIWNMRDGGIVGLQAFGFIAQELLEAQTIVGITVPKLVTTTNPDKYEVAPAALLPIMVKAIQELNAKFETYVATHP